MWSTPPMMSGGRQGNCYPRARMRDSALYRVKRGIVTSLAYREWELIPFLIYNGFLLSGNIE